MRALIDVLRSADVNDAMPILNAFSFIGCTEVSLGRQDCGIAVRDRPSSLPGQTSGDDSLPEGSRTSAQCSDPVH